MVGFSKIIGLGWFSLVSRTAAAGALVLTATAAHATNGYFSNGFGGASKGLSGAGVTVGKGVLSLAQNPALGLNVGNSAGFCLTTFLPDRRVKVPAGGRLKAMDESSKNKMFYIPCGGVNYKIDGKSTFGIIAYGHGGLNTKFVKSNALDLSNTAGSLGVDMSQLFFAANYARKVAPGLTVGFAPVIAGQRINVKGLGDFAQFSTDRSHVSNQGYDYSFGAGFKVGVLWDVNKYFSLGASYQSRMWMQKFDKYKGLFAEQGGFDVPPSLWAGIAIRPAPKQVNLTLLFEYQRIWFGDVKSIANPHSAAFNGTFSGAGNLLNLGADNGAGFGWKDINVFRVAVQYKPTERLTLRSGVAYATDFTDDSEVVFNIIAPATIKWHASMGFSYQIDKNWGFTASYTRAFPEEFKNAQGISLEMDQHEVATGFTYRW